MQTHTIFDFNRDFYTEMLNEFGYHDWVLILTGFIFILLFGLYFFSPKLAGGISLIVVMPLTLWQIHALLDGINYGDQRVNENVRAAYLEHKEEIDTGIDESLAKHDLTRDEVCNHSTVLEALDRNPIAANETLLCGNDAESAQPGMFILNNRDAIVYMGEAEGKVLVAYDPQDDPGTNT